MMRAWMVVVALAGCAQLAPEPADDVRLEEAASELDELAAHEVGLEVGSSLDRRVPIAGASVLIDRGGDALERTATDGDGIARFPAAGVRACHVVYLGDDDGLWHVTTITACRGTIQLGGLEQVHEPRRAMTFELPARDGATAYRLEGPAHCGAWEPSASSTSLALPGEAALPNGSAVSSTITAPYRAVCEGERVHLLACATLASGDRCLDAGEVVLRNGRTHRLEGAYRVRRPVALTVSNLPTDVRELYVDRIARSADEATVVHGPIFHLPGRGGTFDVPEVRGSNQLWLSAARQVGAFRSVTEIITPFASDATAFDATALLPHIYDISLDTDNVMRWGGADGGTIIATQASGSALGGDVYWLAYTDAAATSVAFPALPDDLIDATPTHWDVAHMFKLDVPGATLRQLMKTIDRQWTQWPEHPKLSPPRR